MTAATVTTRFRGAKMAEESVVITVTDGETYVTDMSAPQICHATWQEATTVTSPYSIGTAISGQTITISATGVTDKKLALLIKGYK